MVQVDCLAKGIALQQRKGDVVRGGGGSLGDGGGGLKGEGEVCIQIT